MSRAGRLSQQLHLQLRVECQKMGSLRGNPLPALVVVPPLGFAVLKGLGFWLRGQGLGADRLTYWTFISSGQFFWEELLLPLLTIAACSWLTWMDRETGHWKVLLCQPLTRSSYFISKLFMALATLLLVQVLWWSSHSLLGGPLGLSGVTILPEAGLRALHVWAALCPLIAVQTWLATRLMNPLSAFGVGLAGNTAAMTLSDTAANVWHPWGLTHLAMRHPPEDWHLSAALAAAILLSLAAICEFKRRDICP